MIQERYNQHGNILVFLNMNYNYRVNFAMLFALLLQR